MSRPARRRSALSSRARSRFSQLSPLEGEEIEEFARMKTEHDVGWPERALRHSLRKDDGFWQCRQISSLPVSFARHQLACHPAGLRLRRAQPCAAQPSRPSFSVSPRSVRVVCTENLTLIDYVTESPNVNGDDRAALLLPDPVRLAVQVEEPT